MTDDELLTPKPTVANEQRQAELLGRTTRRVRFAGRARTAVRLGTCLACFAAGAVTTYVRPAPEPRTVYVEVPAAPVADAPRSPEAPPAARVMSPAELELDAEKAVVKAESARLFREAGDRYLRDYADYRAALRCYRNFLDEADAEALTVSAEDTWLLTSLKRARAQENTQ
jgi:hypothetical protein